MGAAQAHAGTSAAALAQAGTRAAPTKLGLAGVAGGGNGGGAHTRWVEAKPPPGAHLGEAIALMRARGLRASAARRLVLEALLVADGPMSAEQIAQGIGGRVPSSDIASVYRNLQALEDIGLVRHVHLGHGPGLHALVVAGEPEYLTCERCAEYHAVAPEELDAIRELIARQFGYHASFAHFPIVGLCASCARAVGKRRLFNGRHPQGHRR